MPANEHCPSIQGRNIFLAGGSVHRQATKSDSKYSIKLNEVFDKLFELLCSLCQGVSQKLRAVMDLLAQCMAKLDAGGRGFCYGWELQEYLLSPLHTFGPLRLSKDEVATFMRFVGQVAALDEGVSIVEGRIKYAFLLAQLEQNFYIRC